MKQELRKLTAIFRVYENVRLGRIAIFEIVRRELIVPFDLACFGVEREHTVRVEALRRFRATSDQIDAGPTEPNGRGSAL